MTPAPLAPHALAFLLGANLGLLACLAWALVTILGRLHTMASINHEVLRMLVIAHADACDPEPVDEDETEGQAERRVA